MSGVRASVTPIALIVLINCVEFALGGGTEIVGTHLVQIRQVLRLHISSCLKWSCFDVRIQLVLQLEDLVSFLWVWLSLRREVVSGVRDLFIFAIELLLVGLVDRCGIATDAKTGISKLTTSVSHLLTSNTVRRPSFCLHVFHLIRPLPILTLILIVIFVAAILLVCYLCFISLASASWGISVLLIGLSRLGRLADLVPYLDVFLSVVGPSLNHDGLP